VPRSRRPASPDLAPPFGCALGSGSSSAPVDFELRDIICRTQALGWQWIFVLVRPNALGSAAPFLKRAAMQAKLDCCFRYMGQACTRLFFAAPYAAAPWHRREFC